MGKSKRKLNDLSILSTFVLLAVVFLLLAMLLVEAERTVLTNAQRDIAFQYSDCLLYTSGGRESADRGRAVYRYAGEVPRADGAAQRRGADAGRSERALRRGTGSRTG